MIVHTYLFEAIRHQTHNCINCGQNDIPYSSSVRSNMTDKNDRGGVIVQLT